MGKMRPFFNRLRHSMVYRVGAVMLIGLIVVAVFAYVHYWRSDGLTAVGGDKVTFLNAKGQKFTVFLAPDCTVNCDEVAALEFKNLSESPLSFSVEDLMGWGDIIVIGGSQWPERSQGPLLPEAQRIMKQGGVVKDLVRTVRLDPGKSGGQFLESDAMAGEHAYKIVSPYRIVKIEHKVSE